VSALHRFVILFALMYAAFGVSSPFLPAFLQGHGLTPDQLGILLGAVTAVRLVSGPLCGRLADATHARRTVLASCAALAALVALGLLSSVSFWTLLAVSMVHAAALAPTTTLADALALGAAGSRTEGKRFEYGWVRGAGSAIFILGTLGGGQIVGAWGLGSIVGLHSALLLGAAAAVILVPETGRQQAGSAIAKDAQPAGVRTLLASSSFRRVMLVSSLVLGSHAMHDAFAVIRWSEAGIMPAMASVLWSESVAAEVVVFFVIGPPLLARLGPASTIALAAGAGVVRWVAMASTTNILALAVVQPLHGLTFAALHLACMRLITAIAPSPLAATAQALYALGAGATTALLTLAAGRLYGSLGAQGFFVMAMLCAMVPLLTRGLRSVVPRSEASRVGAFRT
jgi:PPP family 3-phenylpropionic acid transporter